MMCEAIPFTLHGNEIELIHRAGLHDSDWASYVLSVLINNMFTANLFVLINTN